MTEKMHDWIRKRIEQTSGLTQKGLAACMGLNPAAVNRMLYGRRKIMVEEVSVIESYLGAHFIQESEQRVDDYFQETFHSTNEVTGFADSNHGDVMQQNSSYQATPHRADMVPVYGYAAGSLNAELNLSNGDVVDWVVRHPNQFGLREAFAVYVFSGSMEPRYYPGELIYVHPARLPELNKDCVIEMKNGDAFIKKYIGQDDENIITSQFNPICDVNFPKSDIKAVYAVIGRG